MGDAMGKTRILADYGWVGPHGIGRFAKEVLARLDDVDRLPIEGNPASPLRPFVLGRKLRKLRPDAFFNPGFMPPAGRTVPFVFVIHDLIHLRCPSEATLAKKLFYRTLIRPGARRAYRVLTVSEFSRREILEWSSLPPERVVVVSNGVGDGFTPDGATHSPGYPYLLYVGADRPHKNLPRLLRGLAESEIDDEIRLILTCRASRELLRHRADLGLTDRVVFAPAISDDQLGGYYRGAMATVLVSLYEGFGLPALESMACGTPVVVSQATSLPEVVGQAGLWVRPTEVDSIAHGIHSIVTDAELSRRLAREGIDRARQFTWDKTARKVAQILRDAAAQRRE